MPEPPARSFSARVPCGVSSSSSSPERNCRSNSLFSPTYDDVILRMRLAFSRMPRPQSSTPQLLLTMLRSLVPCASSASMSAMGLPESPNPPTASDAPSGMSATASAAEPHGLVDHMHSFAVGRDDVANSRMAHHVPIRRDRRSARSWSSRRLALDAQPGHVGLRCGADAAYRPYRGHRAETNHPRRPVGRAGRAAAAAGDVGGERWDAGGRARTPRRPDPSHGAPAPHRPPSRGTRRSGRPHRTLDAGTRALPDGHGRGIPVRHHVYRPRHRALPRGADGGERVPLGAAGRRDRLPAAGRGQLPDPLVRAVGGRALSARRRVGGSRDPRLPAAPRCGRLLRASPRPASRVGCVAQRAATAHPPARHEGTRLRREPRAHRRGVSTASARRSSRARATPSGR